MPIKAEPTNAAPNAAIQSPAQDVTKPLDLAGQRKKQLTLMRADVQKLAYLDLQRPFTNLEDAVDRLLPFHVLWGHWVIWVTAFLPPHHPHHTDFGIGRSRRSRF